MVVSNNLVKIETTKSRIIFEPLGRPVTQFTYANIKIHLHETTTRRGLRCMSNNAIIETLPKGL